MYALTFDDGPSPSSSILLTTLTAAGIKASFFAVGTQIDEFPNTLKQEVGPSRNVQGANLNLTHIYVTVSRCQRVMLTLRSGNGFASMLTSRLLSTEPQLCQAAAGTQAY